MAFRKSSLTISAIAITVFAPVVALASAATLSAALTGTATVKGGDPDGSGGFKVTLDPETRDFCYTLWALKIGRPTAAHVHAGAAGASGAVIATLDVTGRNDEMCIALAKDKLEAIADKPAEYYVDIHTADFPDGAVRGQLSK